MKKALIICISLFVWSSSHAQIEKFGKISKVTGDVSQIMFDSTASAVVLFSVGTVEYNKRLEVEYVVHERIKILNENGYDFATHLIQYVANNGSQEVDDLEGITWIEEKPGKFKKIKLSKKDIFKEKNSLGYERIKFTMPALQPGCIIEYTYKVTSGTSFYIPSWVFQRSIPVLYSEFNTEILEYFQFDVDFKGVLPLTDRITTYENRNKNIRIEYGSKAGRSMADFQNINVNMFINKFYMVNIPAFVSEPFITSEYNYKSRLNFELKAIAYPGRNKIMILDSWPITGNKILEREDFTKMMTTDESFPSIISSVVKQDTTPKEKVKALYDYVVNTYKFDEDLDYRPNTTLSELLKKKSGNSASLNLLLIQLCKEIGLKAYPMAISTRRNGSINMIVPTADQFNHLLAVVEVDDKLLFLDATNKNRRFEYLAVRDLNGEGLLLKPKMNSTWVDIENKLTSGESAMVVASVNESGDIEGTVSVLFTGYEAIEIRDTIEELNKTEENKDYVKYIQRSLFKGNNEVELDSIMFSHLDSAYEDPILKFKFKLNRYATVTNESIFFNPILVNSQSNNPFKLETRKYPVDFAYLFNRKVVTQLTYPDGFELAEPISSIQFALPNRAAIYRKIAQNQPNGLMLLSDMRMMKTIFTTSEYKDLKEYYQQMIEAQSQTLFLKKKTVEPVSKGE